MSEGRMSELEDSSIKTSKTKLQRKKEWKINPEQTWNNVGQFQMV